MTDEAQLTVSGTTPFSTSTNVLVGDTVNQAHAGRGSGYSVASHYPAAVFADKDQRTYYRTFTVDDIEDFGSTKTRYWKRVDNTIYLYSTPALAIASYGS